MSNAFIDQALLERTVRHATAYLRSLPDRHVGARASRQDLLDALGGALPEDGHESAAVVDDLAAAADRGAIGSAGPRYFGFVIGGALPASVAADWLTSTWDQNAGIFVTSPLSSVIEEIARGWLLNLFSLPSDASLGFVTGCQMANFTCLAAARHAVLRTAGWDVEQDGLNGAPRISVVLGAEAHVTIFVALRMLGLGVRNVRLVATDEQGRIKADDLRRTLKGIEGPAIVCAQAGNVNSGAFDPLREIGEAVREQGAWLHVDAAFGLWAAVSDELRHLLDGVDLADSWATDAHKWLNVPYDCGVTIVRDLSAHRASMTSAAAYIQKTTGAERDPMDWVPEFSRRARGVTVYAALRALGRRGIVDLIERSCARARQFAELLSRDKRVKILNDVVLNQVLVRFGDSDEMTSQVIALVQQEGTCWLAGTTWHDMAAMRISVSNWATSESDVRRSAEAVLGCLSRASRD
ncbi:MAG TPA: aminotransferase class V-fold PLP-dependent enzyme [Thermoanaerobaculia bacterium]|nr:aminotransferase class V-fold PLP-dependent enzyme [Thermoanaerobaculia bacterium]